MKHLFILCLAILSFTSKASIDELDFSSDDYVICDVLLSSWPEVEEQGYLRIPPYSDDEFLHCAKSSQIHHVMNKYFMGKSYMMFITHKSKLKDRLVYENGYPHLYGILDMNLVEYKYIQTPDINGDYNLPENLKSNRPLSCKKKQVRYCPDHTSSNCKKAFQVQCTMDSKVFLEAKNAENILKRLKGIKVKF